MTIYVIGGGWYGCHTAWSLINRGYDVQLIESSDDIFSGASGNNPARLHLGFHYPRSQETRQHCLDHYQGFMERYGFLTRPVPVNLYAIAKETSYIDFGTYTQVLRPTNEFITLHNPEEFGLYNVEGAILTGERHIVIDQAKEFFRDQLTNHIRYNRKLKNIILKMDDIIVDCTFSALDGRSIDRFEPCLTVLLSGPVDTAVTIMDGPFPSLYPWNEDKSLNSLTSALYTPFSKSCKSYGEARHLLDSLSPTVLKERAREMIHSMAYYYPRIQEYSPLSYRVAIRAMPLSGADSRLVNIEVQDRTIRVRAGKIDAIINTADRIEEIIGGFND